MSKFIEIQTSNDTTKKNEWFEHCRQKGTPCVVVNSEGNTASVEWDYITYPMESEELFKEKEVYLRVKLMEIYSKYSTKKSTYSISGATVNFAGFSIQDAKTAADEIYDLIDTLIKSKAR